MTKQLTIQGKHFKSLFEFWKQARVKNKCSYHYFTVRVNDGIKPEQAIKKLMEPKKDYYKKLKQKIKGPEKILNQNRPRKLEQSIKFFPDFWDRL